ncbi:hypothetical protein H8959_012337 [Pygathrix nigripes]
MLRMHRNSKQGLKNAGKRLERKKRKDRPKNDHAEKVAEKLEALSDLSLKKTGREFPMKWFP